MQLSNQALGAIMMALQESLLNELDIVPILSGFKLLKPMRDSLLKTRLRCVSPTMQKSPTKI